MAWSNELSQRRQRQPCFVNGALSLTIALLMALASYPRERAWVEPVSRRQGHARVESQLLEHGRAVGGEIAGGQIHEFSFLAAAGQFTHLSVKQFGIDVVLVFFPADGREPLEMDKANGTRGTEGFSLVLDAAGTYRIQVRAREEKAEAGRYAVGIVEARTATPQDSARAAADRAFVEARRWMSQRKKEAYLKAREKYEEALRLSGEANDPEGEAAAVLNLATALYYSDGPRHALPKYKEAAQKFDSVNEPHGKAIALFYVRMCEFETGERESVLASYRQSLEDFTTLDDQKYLAFALNELGRVYYLMGDGPAARDHFLRAAEIRRRIDDRKGLSYSLNVVGRIYYQLGDEEQAINHYQQALAIQRQLNERPLAAQTLDDIGRIALSSGQIEDALSRFAEALKLQEDAGDKVGAAETLSYTGMAYSALGRHAEALDKYFGRALKIQRDEQDRVGEGRTLHNMGVAHLALGDGDNAAARLNEALAVWQSVLYRTAEAETRYWIARAENRRGRLEEARRQMEAALPVVESLRTRIFNQHLRISYFATVQKYYELYVDVLMRMHDRSPAAGLERAALLVNERARARSLLDTLVEAGAGVGRGVEPLLLKRERELQFQLSDISQRRMLSGRQTPAQEAEAKKRIGALLAQYREVEALIREKSPAYAALTQPPALTIEDLQTGLLDRETMLLEFALGDERSYLWAVTHDSVVRHVLPKREEIEGAAARLREATTARNRLSRREKPEEVKALEKKADTQAAAAAQALGEMLSLAQATARPGVKRLLIVSDGELQHVPFAFLPVRNNTAARPATATVDPAALLISHYELVPLASVSLLAELRRGKAVAQPPDPTRMLVVLADPVFSPDDERVVEARKLARRGLPPAPPRPRPSPTRPAPTALPEVVAAARAVGAADTSGQIARLPFTRHEAIEIEAMLPGLVTKFVDFEVSRKTIDTGLLGQYRIVHFGTHGLMNSEHPELSGILLSMVDKDGAPQNGFLQLHEVYDLNLPADLVVLSACESGVGKKIRGEGMMALTRGFMYAGAKRVVATLWKVNDAATARLMRYFYQSMLRDGQTPAAALRAAQLEMLKQPTRQSPYYWAGFVAQGDWQGWNNGRP